MSVSVSEHQPMQHDDDASFGWVPSSSIDDDRRLFIRHFRRVSIVSSGNHRSAPEETSTQSLIDEEEVEQALKMSWTDDVLSGMSAETLAALKEFASLSGIKLDKANEGATKTTAADEDDDNDPLSILTSLRNHFQLPASERETTYPIHYESSAGIEARRVIDFSVKGVKRELGQTLDSTGLTIWRAAEHLCQYLIDHPHRFGNKYICELGCGLGLVSILLEKMNLENTRIVATDGDEPTLQLLIENKVENECDFETAYLYWGQDEDFVQEYCHAGKFDVLLAADVIYEDDQVLPLITTASRILKPDGEFILAFARRNVPMDKVLDCATAFNFQYEILTDEHDTSRTFDGTEPIYRFTWKK